MSIVSTTSADDNNKKTDDDEEKTVDENRDHVTCLFNSQIGFLR